MKVGILYSRLRKDENLIIQELEKRGHKINLIDDKEIIFNLEGIDKNKFDVDIILERCISHSRAAYSLKILNESAVPTINTAETTEICGSKFLVTEAFLSNNVPHPPVSIAFNRTQALKAIETIGYPVVMKPAIGSWGTLLAKINDLDAAQAILAHKKVLGSFHHAIYYIQKYINKPGRDIRVFVVGNKVVDAIYRKADFWITHLDHGAKIEHCPITPEIEKIALDATRAVAGDIVAVDIVEDRQKQLLVLEVDYTVEFTQYSPIIDEHKMTSVIVDYIEQKVKLK